MSAPAPKDNVEISGQNVVIYEHPHFPDDAKSQLRFFGALSVGVSVSHGAHLYFLASVPFLSQFFVTLVSAYLARCLVLILFWGGRKSWRRTIFPNF